MADKKEYIERGALIAELQEELDFYPLLHTKEFNDGFNAGLKRALRLVKSQPATDVVEVVRCKDCKHGQRNNSGDFKGRYICEYHQDYKPLFSPYHFCSYGEMEEKT